MSRIALNREETFYPQVFRETNPKADPWGQDFDELSTSSTEALGVLRTIGHYLVYTAAATFMTIGIMTTVLAGILVAMGVLTA